jgi:hypothetical protein
LISSKVERSSKCVSRWRAIRKISHVLQSQRPGSYPEAREGTEVACSAPPSIRRLRPARILLPGNHVAFGPGGDIDFSLGVICCRTAELTPAVRVFWCLAGCLACMS